MDRSQIESWADAYIGVQSAPPHQKEGHPSYWAIDKFMLVLDDSESPEDCFSAILTVLEKEPSDDVLGVLAAGPLEDLLHYHGTEFIDKIEIEARRNPEFRDLLGGVWYTKEDELQKRLNNIIGERW
jgi:hypothetical protein